MNIMDTYGLKYGDPINLVNMTETIVKMKYIIIDKISDDIVNIIF